MWGTGERGSEPDHLDDTERPRARQEAVGTREQAVNGERRHESVATPLTAYMSIMKLTAQASYTVIPTELVVPVRRYS
jgi:hypothetical protein